MPVADRWILLRRHEGRHVVSYPGSQEQPVLSGQAWLRLLMEGPAG